jgi:Domain of unknown function (DUF4398)
LPAGTIHAERGRVKTLVAAACLGLAACATGEPPVAQMSSARSMVSQAHSLAGRYAPAELTAAQTKLAQAEAAYRAGEWTSARRLAEQSEVDASFALSVAENERSRRASAELAQSIDQLKRELEGRPQ